MARPQKQRTPPPDRPLQVSLHEYLGRQNDLANQIRQYQGLATTLLSYVSQQVGMASQAIGVLQQSTQSTLEANGVDPTDDGLTAFPQIAGLLRMDKAELGNPFAGGGGYISHMDLTKIAKQAKKQKKPRKAKDPNAPQRPQTAFFLYQMANREKFRNEMQANNPDVKPGDVQKRLTETWNNMSQDQQKPYKDQYAKENEKYNQAKAQYEKETGKNIGEGSAPEDAMATAAQTEPADASGDAESSGDEESESASSSSSSSSASPSPPPKKSKSSKSSKKSKDRSSSKEASPEKKKRKHAARDESDDEETPKKKKKSRDNGEKSAKKKKRDSNIDPELARMDKEQRKQKHPDYAPAQPTFGAGAGAGMAPMAGMGSMGGGINSNSMGQVLQSHMNNMPSWQPR